MSETTQLRRHLYEQYAGLRRLRDRRARRALRRQIGLLAATSPGRGDGGPTGVREPRRPHSPRDGAAASRWA